MGKQPGEIIKGSRHQRIIGDFGESLICNWLSRSGFEAAIVDHTGIDIIAYNPLTQQRLGITVKSRTRTPGKEDDSVNIFFNRKNDRQKVEKACKAFECEPWIAVYVETTKFADVYLTSLENYDQKYRGSEERVIDNWKMKDKDREKYEADCGVNHIRIEFHVANWWQSKEEDDVVGPREGSVSDEDNCADEGDEAWGDS